VPTNLLMIGKASNYFDEFLEIAEEAGLKGVTLVPVDNLTNPLSGINFLESFVRGGVNEEIFFMPIPGAPLARRTIYDEAVSVGLKVFPAIIHPSSSLGKTTTLGVGSLVSRLVSTGFDCTVGLCCQINRSASLGHHCVVEDFVTISPSATLLGSVRVGSGSFIGAGSVILPGVSIGQNSVVGAGAVVTRDVEPGTTVIGNPARKMI
jgi:sugar O-acyltransferase (sialic acid O-acetyltransferase NeuD family)